MPQQPEREDPRLQPVQPEGWAKPSGYANGVLVDGAHKLLFVAGQIAWDSDQRLVAQGDFPGQFRQALANVIAVVCAAGGTPDSIAQLTIYVTDKRQYVQSGKELGGVYRELMGRHYPAMALVQVADLLEEGALVEIQATAALGQ